MKLFGYNINISNIDKKQPNRAEIINTIVKRQLLRHKQDISNWRSATQSAESDIRPNRTELYRIYKDVVLDAHLTGLWSSLKNKILSNSFYLVNSDGTINEEETSKLETKWFRDYMGHIVDTKFWGHSLIQLGSIVDDKFSVVKVVNRENIVPEDHIILKERNGEREGDNAIDYTKGIIKNWTVEVGDRESLGLLHKLTPLILWKKNVMIAWAQYCELFGMPIRLGKTDIRDPDRNKNMATMLDNMGQAGWGVFDKEDDLQLVAANDEDAYQVFERLIELLNREMSKLVSGQTMTSEDGSSRSQAEVHERMYESYITSCKFEISDSVNDDLMPLMVMHGVIPDGLKFKFDDSERLTLREQFDVVAQLLHTQKYSIPAEYIKATFGIPVEEIKMPDMNDPNLGVDNRLDGMEGGKTTSEDYNG